MPIASKSNALQKNGKLRNGFRESTIKGGKRDGQIMYFQDSLPGKKESKTKPKAEPKKRGKKDVDSDGKKKNAASDSEPIAPVELIV